MTLERAEAAALVSQSGSGMRCRYTLPLRRAATYRVVPKQSRAVDTAAPPLQDF